ncbi:MAG: SDR family oxidoreductase [Actinomycetia bacterium]|nr:SDR family oxidoreductase [Actinomycetes bacterium]
MSDSTRTDPQRPAALVTGATGGIGEAIVEALAGAGFDLTVTGRRKDRLDALAEEMSHHGTRVAAVPADLTTEDDIESLVAAHGSAYGRMDVMVNCAGGGILRGLEKQKIKHIDLQLDLNLRSAVVLFRAGLPLLREAVAAKGFANVVNVSSAAGKHGQPGLTVYSAAKHGLVGFTEASNAEFGAEGIRSTVFCPGLVDTPLAAAYDTAAEDMVRPTDLATAVLWLVQLSPRCLIPEISFLSPTGALSGDGSR